MFVDYLTVLMINLAAGTALLAYFVLKGINSEDKKGFAAGFGVVGLVALIGGMQMTFNWPLPGSYNIAYGESTLLFGAVFLGAALALAQGWDLLPISIFAFFAGVNALVVGVRIIDLPLSKHPVLTGIGFILAGLGGIAAAPTLHLLKKNQNFRYLAAAVLLITSVFWAYTFYNSVWAHLESFSSWVPLTMGQ